MIKKFLNFDIGDTAYLVFADRLHRKMKKDIVIEIVIDNILINENGTMYTAELKKIVVGSANEDLKKYVKYLTFKDNNIDTGYCISCFYPVFTTKEKTIAYLKGGGKSDNKTG